MAEKLYASRRPWDLEPYYSAHVSAMTSEELHSKADIAEELAFRDKRIAELNEALLVLADKAGPVANDMAHAVEALDAEDEEAAEESREILQELNFALEAARKVLGFSR